MSPVRIYAGGDHAGVKLKGILVAELRRAGHQVVDLGTGSEESTDYPDWAAQVARAVRDDADPATARGLITCGSGVGVSIVANKVAGVRAVDAWNEDLARVSRAHNDTNVLCLGARFVDEAQARAILNTWLATGFEGGRHERRLGKIAAVEFGEGAQAAVRRETALLASRRVPRRIWAHDPTVFVADGETNEVARKSILSRLGWLRSPDQLAPQLNDVLAFAADVRARGFTRAVLLGMGGSSLCPEVLATTFGARGGAGIPVQVLDSTDPDAVAAIDAGGDPDRTLFVVASKSGGTIEVASFENFFWRRALDRVGPEKASKQFCAITDLNTELHLRARDRYHQVFVNPSDIGGRYSALSLFGLVPAALLGIDVKGLVARGQEMARACQKDDIRDNPGASLGAYLGALAKQGRDKLTLLLGPEVASLGAWIEQLVAESTGKLGRGIVPVDLEPAGPPAAYGDDRAFVVVTVKGGEAPAGVDVAGLRMAGHPVLEIVLPDTLALGAEFYRWEFATAVAGASLGINPFDEPNVTEAKEATGRAIKAYWQKGALPDPGPVLSGDDAALAADLQAHLSTASPGDYICVAAFFRQTPERDRLLSEIRRVCRDRWHVATTLGYGPRFLHSTGQLHKGGPNSGVFLQLTASSASPATDLQVPERGFSFGVLRDAQALGDLEALRQHKRRVARVALGQDIEAGLERVLAALTSAPQA